MEWLFLTRVGSENDLVEELGRKAGAGVVSPGVVVSEQRPRGHDGHLLEPAFARQALKLAGRAQAAPERVAKTLGRLIKARLPRKADATPWTWTLQVVVPDSSDPQDQRRPLAAELEAALPAALAERLPESVMSQQVHRDAAERLVQVWVLSPEYAHLGVTPSHQAVSREAGGRTKLKRPADAVSRSGLKLEEAMQWAGVGPDKGDLCADLGSAPGGWTQVAVGRGATVIAVDPAKMKVELPKKRFAHAQMSAFDYTPAETLDWVICDMAWRPLEVAKLLAKWSRRIWARQMIANFKLPMTQKASMLRQILEILSEAGWHGLRARQLYHDRDEVTVFGYLDPGRAHLDLVPAFELRSRGNKSKGKGKSDGASKKKGAPRKPARPRTRRSRGRDEAKPRQGGPRRGAGRGAGRAGAKRSGRKGPRGR